MLDGLGIRGAPLSPRLFRREDSFGRNGKPLSPEELQALCIEAREKFYSVGSILRRFADPVNRSTGFMARQFPLINFMMRREVQQRNDLPLGDEGWQGQLRPAMGMTTL